MKKTVFIARRARAGLQVEDTTGQSRLSICLQMIAEPCQADVSGGDADDDTSTLDIVLELHQAREISDQLAKLVRQASSELG